MANDVHNNKDYPKTDAEPDGNPGAPVTYTFDGRTFIVNPVFKERPAHTVSAALLRLMRSDLETS